jgi:hypothetical protein
MTALTIEEYMAYLAKDSQFFNLKWQSWGNSFSPYYDNPEAKCVEMPFPKEASGFANLAVYLPILTKMDAVEWGGGTLIFTDWGIWDQQASLAGYQMVERIRSTFGEHRPFNVATVNRFRQDEHLILTNFILAALIYGWDAYYIPNYRGCFVHISHDEWCCVVTERNEDFKEITEPQLNDPESGYRILTDSRFCSPATLT